MKFKEYLKEEHEEKVKIIEKQIEQDFGSIAKAKQKVKKVADIWWKKYDKWNSLEKKEKVTTMPPVIDDYKIEIKKEGYKFYYSKNNPSYKAINGQGKGFYVDIQGPAGLTRYKIFK